MRGPPAVIDDVAVVIPTVGRPTLARCLDAIREMEAWPAQLIVSLQGGPATVYPEVADALGRCVRAGLGVELVRTANEVGTAAATNRGLERVGVPFVGVTHDDCVVTGSWLRRLRAALDEAPASVVTGRVTPEAGRSVPSTVVLTEPFVLTRPRLGVDPLFPANMGAARRTFLRVGPFDEDARLAHAAEDNDWAYRALRLEVPIAYHPEIEVVHLAWRDADHVRETYRRYARAQGAFYGKHLRRGDRFIAARFLLDVVHDPIAWARATRSGDSELAGSAAAAVRHLIPGVWAGVRRRW